MGKGLGVMRAVIGVMTVLVCLLFVWQAVDIYRTGDRAENFSAPGVRIEQVYTRADIAERFGRIAPAVYAYIALAAAGLVWQAVAKEKKPRPDVIAPAEKKPEGHIRAVRLALLGAGVLLTVLGAANGGAHDVLVKAVNICTECIGLG